MELLRRLNDAGKDIARCPVTPAALAELLAKVEKRRNHRRQRQKSVRDDVRHRQDAQRRSSPPKVSRRSSDTGAIEKIAREVVAKSPDNLAKYRAGNEGVFKFFVGQVMRETRGQANPQIVNEILKRVLAEA